MGGAALPVVEVTVGACGSVGLAWDAGVEVVGGVKVEGVVEGTW